jgi:hypothetical protein
LTNLFSIQSGVKILGVGLWPVIDWIG